jgi:hypothetical protein
VRNVAPSATRNEDLRTRPLVPFHQENARTPGRSPPRGNQSCATPAHDDYVMMYFHCCAKVRKTAPNCEFSPGSIVCLQQLFVFSTKNHLALEKKRYYLC